MKYIDIFYCINKKWAIFKNNKSDLALKQPSGTRWKSRIDASRFARYQQGEIDALYIKLWKMRVLLKKIHH